MSILEPLCASNEARNIQAALESSHAAFAYFDPADRLTFWNHAYIDLNFRIRGMIRRGVTFPDLLAELVLRGQIEIADGDIEAWIANRMQARRRGNTVIRHLADGRSYLVQERRDKIGGTLGVWLNVTDLCEAGALRKDHDVGRPAVADHDEPQNEIRSSLQRLICSLEILNFSARSEPIGPVIDDCLDEAKIIGTHMDRMRTS
ncbi:MAG: PAS-domain containing protein [Pseudomonadota bacterium]